MKKRVASIIGLMIFTGLFYSCYAVPTDDDVMRVKRHFLTLRFNAPMNPELNRMNDLDLFRESCMANRVRCDAVLDKLKKTDPDFHEKLTATGASNVR